MELQQMDPDDCNMTQLGSEAYGGVTVEVYQLPSGFWFWSYRLVSGSGYATAEGAMKAGKESVDKLKPSWRQVVEA